LRQGRGGVTALAALLAALFLVPASARAQTIVTLTFDDGLASQDSARTILAQHGMQGTFFINSGNIGRNDAYLTWSQLSQFAADGMEIGGHTVTHMNISAGDPDEIRRQVCDDRMTLLSQGYDVRNFAYPNGRTSGIAPPPIRFGLAR
jgi:peptidoglycan/xylan/chitin deacetylase (PgdA/CDA1 family)